MQNSRPFTLVAAAIFGLMALVHIYRAFTGFPVEIAGHSISQAVSWIAVLISGLLSVGLFREARR